MINKYEKTLIQGFSINAMVRMTGFQVQRIYSLVTRKIRVSTYI